MFYEMQCLKCHVLGDPNVEGANKAPTAPNLSLVQRRLQPRWVRHWVQEPAIIQVGTAMPPFLTGQAIWDYHGMAWPRSQGVAEAEVKRAADQLRAATLMSREKPSARCEQLASQLLIYGRPITPAEAVARIDAVTIDDLKRLARRLAQSAPTLTTRNRWRPCR